MKQKKRGHSGEFHHKHSLGQNFIEDEALLEQLAEYSLVSDEDCVLEIGPGFGALTKPLARRCKQIVSLEIDKTLTITAKQVAGFNVINGANCNNEVVVLIKVTVE